MLAKCQQLFHHLKLTTITIILMKCSRVLVQGFNKMSIHNRSLQLNQIFFGLIESYISHYTYCEKYLFTSKLSMNEDWQRITIYVRLI